MHTPYMYILINIYAHNKISAQEFCLHLILLNYNFFFQFEEKLNQKNLKQFKKEMSLNDDIILLDSNSSNSKINVKDEQEYDEDKLAKNDSESVLSDENKKAS